MILFRKCLMGDVSGYVKCDWSVVMCVSGYVIYVILSIWSIVVESYVLRKLWVVIMIVLGVVIKSVK